MTRKEKQEHRGHVVEEQMLSGLTVTAFCRDRDIRPGQFHYWRRRLAPVADGFVELRCPDRKGAGIRLSRNGWQIAVDRDFDAETLQRVIALIPCSV
jgi:hypothetical protein